MQLRTFKSIVDDVYKVSMYTQEWSEGDKLLMQRFGEPEINVGGTIPMSPSSYELDDAYKRIMSESPFAISFDLDDYDDAEDRANAWQVEIATRISAAVTALRAETDTFTGETVVAI